MNILAWIVLGVLAGAIAKAIYPGHQGGNIISTLLLGIVGAFLGGTLATLLTTGELAMTATSLSIPGVVVAVLGAIIAIFIWQRFVQRGVS
ncbi:GlsB/YeaQ/YmgE family stress response membrane protein [Coleofasciculus sp. E2-BRE-01]|uniref:GlsB/YeaQ/YmgE family stress response membrane protein n=1 Tax=Coleofasciculus sp. E2-BRE-01 TaxID=3069524 RepID=UPI0032FC6246